MKVSRQPKVSALLRVFAGTCALLWLVGIAVCGIARVCNSAGQEGVCAAHASPSPVREHGAVSPQEQGHSHDAEHHDHAGAHEPAMASHHQHDGAAPQHCADKNGCNDKYCCSTIQGFVQTPPAVVIPKLVSQLVLNISLSCAALDHVFAAPRSETLRPTKPHDWVFTPEVCLGPALHNLAPPALA